MACDRFVYFKKRPGPTRHEFEACVRSMVNDTGVDVKDDGDRLFISFPGKPSAMLAPVAPQAQVAVGIMDTRWIEGIWDSDEDGVSIDILTRCQDDFVSAIADRLVEVFARFWEGEVDE